MRHRAFLAAIILCSLATIAFAENQLVGPECEGIELYPAESRLVDTSNKYHLWVVKDPTFRFGVGFHERDVDYDTGKATHTPGMKQRDEYEHTAATIRRDAGATDSAARERLRAVLSNNLNIILAALDAAAAIIAEAERISASGPPKAAELHISDLPPELAEDLLALFRKSPGEPASLVLEQTLNLIGRYGYTIISRF